MNRFLYFLTSLAALALVSCGDRSASSRAERPPMPVQISSPVVKTVELSEVYTGRFEAVEDVVLNARVSGYLESAHFDEGQKVEKGDLLFQIDPRPFDAMVNAATANVQQASARVSLAEGNLKRAENLVGSAISREEYEIRKSEVAQAQADKLAAEAELERAQLDRKFADVTAPISGIAGDFMVTPGNFISGGSANSTPLTTIMPHHPIHCTFEVDERQVLKFTRMYFEGKTEGREGDPPEVEIAVSDRDEFEFKGVIDYSANELDEATATFQLRALVQNEDEFLTPGLFAKIRIQIGEPFEAILVPDSALGFDQSKRFAWVLGDDNTVKRRFVETGALEGEMRIIEAGLTADETIVVSGIQLLQDGMPVSPIDETTSGEPAPVDDGKSAEAVETKAAE